ncbi:MAG: isocitrate lyase/phosphoenolpyruvate mutase family protein [Kineosporiaceae bacterium]
MSDTSAKRAAFRALHAAGFFVLPNAWDVGSARRLAAMGFRAIATTSSGAAWAVGLQDGELGRDGVLRHLEALVAATDLPVNADFENGFADDPDGVAGNVELAAATGVAALSIEDWSGSAIYDQGLAVERLQAARAALDAAAPDVMLIGRHEHFRVPDEPVEHAISRAVAYAAAGADCVYVPFIRDPRALDDLVAAVAPTPVNVLVHDYDDTIAHFARLGVRRVSVGGSLAARAWAAFDDAAQTLKAVEDEATVRASRR